MISHSNVTEQIVQYFKDNINSGNWKVGEKIPSENQLTKILGVSRASIRTAIQHLVGLGVLESRHGKGTYLLDDQVDENTGSEMKITSKDCLDIWHVLELRQIIESEACCIATKKATPELLEELQECLKIMSENKGNREQFVSADIRFHEAICHATQNPLLAKSMMKIFDETRKNHDQMYEIFGFEDGIYYHTLILKAMQNKASSQARELMYEHMQTGINRLNNSKSAHKFTDQSVQK